MGRAGIRASERPRATQAPVLFPSRELMVAKLQRKGGIGRIETGYARRSIGEIDLRASPPGVVDERHAERDRNLLGAHAESERRRIGFDSTKGGPADEKRRSDALECQCSSPAGMRRNAHGRPPTRAPIFGPLMEASQAGAERAHLAATPAPRSEQRCGLVALAAAVAPRGRCCVDRLSPQPSSDLPSALRNISSRGQSGSDVDPPLLPALPPIGLLTPSPVTPRHRADNYYPRPISTMSTLMLRDCEPRFRVSSIVFPTPIRSS